MARKSRHKPSVRERRLLPERLSANDKVGAQLNMQKLAQEENWYLTPPRPRCV